MEVSLPVESEVQIAETILPQPEKKFACDFIDDKTQTTCPSSFSNKYHLKTHINAVHKKIKNFSCDILYENTKKRCTSKFYSKQQLNNHINTVHEKIKNFSCDMLDENIKIQCTSKFYSKKELKTHINAVHEKIKNFSCDMLDEDTKIQCTSKFYSKQELKTHIKAVHEKIKNFSCDRLDDVTKIQCRSKFFSKNQLKSHIERMHYKIKNIKCKDCDKKFYGNQEMMNHWFIAHSKEFRFICNFCGYGYHRKTRLSEHISKYHNGETISIRFRKWEQRIKELLTYYNLNYEYNTRFILSGINGSKNEVRQFDFIIYKDNCVLILEIDENAHQSNSLTVDPIESKKRKFSDLESDNNNSEFKEEDEASDNEYDSDQEESDEEEFTSDCTHSYNISCEQARMMTLITYLKTERKIELPIGIIRYNPNSFKLDHLVQQKSQEDRENQLLEVLNNWNPTSDLEIQYMFYNTLTIDTHLISEVCLHKEYDQMLANQCRTAII